MRRDVRSKPFSCDGGRTVIKVLFKGSVLVRVNLEVFVQRQLFKGDLFKSEIPGAACDVRPAAK